MALVWQIAVGMVSGAFFCRLLWRGFARPKDSPRLFGRFDLIIAAILSALFVWAAYGLFQAAQPALKESSVVNSIITQAMAGAIVLGYLALRRVSLRQFLGLGETPVWKLFALGSVLMLGVFPLVGVLANWLNADPGQEQEAIKFLRVSDSFRARALLVFMAVVIAPFVEEFLFRGLIYRILKNPFGRIGATVFTSLLFASIHGSAAIFLPLTLVAFALTAGLEMSGSLLVSIAMHATFNAINVAFIFAEAHL